MYAGKAYTRAMRRHTAHICRLDRLGITRQISHHPWLACPVALGQEAMRGVGYLYQELNAGKL